MYIHKSKKGRRKESKKVNQMRHALDRAKRRYDLHLTRKDLSIIVMLIQQGKARLIEARSERARVYELEWEGQLVRVAYDAKRKNPASFLPRPETPST